MAIVQYGGIVNHDVTKTDRSPIKGLIAVLASCMTAGFSGMLVD